MKLVCFETDSFKINSVEIVWKDRSTPPIKLIKEEACWATELELNEGHYLYRLFINESVLLNDPLANMYFPDEDNVLWSVLMVNSDGERLYNNEQYTVNIKEYIITDNIHDNTIPRNKKIFIPPSDKIVATRFVFDNVTGIHTVSALWITPDNATFDICEDNLFANNTLSNITIWFYLNLHKNGVSYPHGIWKLKLFIDGEFILEDEFEIKHQPVFLNQA